MTVGGPLGRHGGVEGGSILVVAGDRQLLDLARSALTLAGHEVEHVTSGPAALRWWRKRRFDVLVIDTSLPGLNAIPRQALEDAGALVLFLAPDEMLDAMASEVGVSGDDYLSLPLRVPDLLVRVEILLRRRGGAPARRELTLGELRLDSAACVAWRGERELNLSPAEYRLLWELVERPGTVLSKEHISWQVWREMREDNAIERLVSRLRKKVDADGPALIQTHRGFGYSIAAER